MLLIMCDKKFNENLSLLKNNLDALNLKLGILEKYLTNLENCLILLEEINQQVINLDNLLSTVDSMLIALTVIPVLTTEVNMFEHNIKKIINIVHPARINVENFCNKYVIPTKNDIISCNDMLDGLTKKIKILSDEILNLQNIISSIKNDKVVYLECKVNPIIETINNMLVEIINTIDTIENEISIIVNKFKLLTNINNSIIEIIENFHLVSRMIYPLHKALEEKITMSQPKNNIDTTASYWTSVLNFIWKELSVLEWYWHNKAEPIVYTIYQIFKGIDGIADTIINELENEANKILEPLINTVNFKIGLPSAEELIKLEEEIKIIEELIKLDNIKIIENKFGVIVDEFNKLNNGNTQT
ncbi:putative ORFan [Tupanvirus deep ocean]|uniref:ORFan n=2 Tax=Tupanvirus TaxID=2094720 RepID=A0AC62A9V1_9VIRU|nr:putative ORFan [Tupanvirus deep ocean]QKU34562.1 putative ORFan [Tupanvirus deep ocean]